MFLIERFVSLFTFASVFLVAMLGISCLKKPQYKFVLWGYLLCLVFFAYIYKPWITALTKAMNYSTNANEYLYVWEIIIGLIEQMQMYFVLYIYKKHEKNSLQSCNLFWSFALIVGMISLCSLPFSYAIFRRYTIVSSLFLIPLLGKLCSPFEGHGNKLFIQLMWFLSLMIFALPCVRGYLCGYKFFVLGQV